jgi:transcriptional regulator with XRE-family HTH domain
MDNELLELIKAGGYNPYDLSEELGYTRPAIYHWIKGTREPCARTMLDLAEKLNVPVERIVRIFGGK